MFKYWKGLRKSVQPSCKSFQTVSESVEYTLTSTELGFFSFIASHIEPFLVKYQTDWPMVPFLYDDLISSCRKLLELIVKPSLISVGKTSYDLMQIDLSDSKGLLKISDVQIEFFALREVQRYRKCDEIALDFVKVVKNECRLFVTSILNKIFEKYPLRSVIVKSCRLFIPSLMATSTVESNKNC